MKGLDLDFCQHVHKDAKLVQHDTYIMNPNYAVPVKEEIDKLLKVGFIRRSDSFDQSRKPHG